MLREAFQYVVSLAERASGGHAPPPARRRHEVDEFRTLAELTKRADGRVEIWHSRDRVEAVWGGGAGGAVLRLAPSAQFAAALSWPGGDAWMKPRDLARALRAGFDGAASLAADLVSFGAGRPAGLPERFALEVPVYAGAAGHFKARIGCWLERDEDELVVRLTPTASDIDGAWRQAQDYVYSVIEANLEAVYGEKWVDADIDIYRGRP
jgi:hypothetical protein